MTMHEHLSGLNRVYGIWHVNADFRVTYVAQGWLVVWDHRVAPPTRYDCKSDNHAETCGMAESKLKELTSRA